jgi:hypothetical protein
VKLLVILFAVAMGSSGETVLREVNRLGMRQKIIALDAGEFKIAHIERLSRAELGSKPRTYFIQLVIYGDKGGAPLPKPSHLAYDQWRRLHVSSSQYPNEMAEMIAIGNNAVLRVREASGNIIERRVLAGKDPLRIQFEGGYGDIVYLAVAAPSASRLQRADIYVTTDQHLKPGMGLDLLRNFQPVFPEMDVYLAIRNDIWFVYEPNYPFSNPFLTELNPPNADEYASTRTLKCGRLSGATSCRLE